MKFLRVAGLHYSFAKNLPYKHNPKLHSFFYEEQLAEIFSYSFHYGDSLTKALGRYGYSATEILFDAEILQKTWARENGVSFSEENWQTEILVAQIQKIRPEILYIHNLNAIPLGVLKRRKELFPFLRTLIIFRGYPEINKPLFQMLSSADLLLVGSPILETICRKNGLDPVLFHHFFDERLLSRVGTEKIYPFTFVGTSGFGYGWNHQPRYCHLLELLKKTNIECWLEEDQEVSSSWKEKVKRVGEILFSQLPFSYLEKLNESQQLTSSLRKMAFNGLARKSSGNSSIFPVIPLRKLFPSRCKDPLFGLEMVKILSSSDLTFNKHTFAAATTVDNIRLFEATGGR